MFTNSAKIFNDEHEYISLLDLSKQQKYSLEFLLNAASRGQLKSFKMSDKWFTTLDWFNDYQKVVKQAVLLEISNKDIDRNNDWVNYLPASGFRLKFIPQLILILVTFSFFSWSLSWLAFSSDGHKWAMASQDITKYKYVLGDKFLYYTGQVYSFGDDYLSFVARNSFETVAVVAQAIISLDEGTTYIALVADQNIGQHKISDEFLTNRFSELASRVKAKYQAVAGASMIRNQIYYQDWENSAKSDD